MHIIHIYINASSYSFLKNVLHHLSYSLTVSLVLNQHLEIINFNSLTQPTHRAYIVPNTEQITVKYCVAAIWLYPLAIWLFLQSTVGYACGFLSGDGSARWSKRSPTNKQHTHTKKRYKSVKRKHTRWKLGPTNWTSDKFSLGRLRYGELVKKDQHISCFFVIYVELVVGYRKSGFVGWLQVWRQIGFKRYSFRAQVETSALDFP